VYTTKNDKPYILKPAEVTHEYAKHALRYLFLGIESIEFGETIIEFLKIRGI